MTARVLVVDDIPPNVKLLEAKLTAEYFDVLTAMNGPDALAICKQGLRHRAARRHDAWHECASTARIIYGGRFHPESCRLIRKLTSGLAGRPAGSKPRDKGRLGRPSDPTGRSVSEVRVGLERVDADADPSLARGRPRGQGSNRHMHLFDLPGLSTGLECSAVWGL